MDRFLSANETMDISTDYFASSKAYSEHIDLRCFKIEPLVTSATPVAEGLSIMPNC